MTLGERNAAGRVAAAQGRRCTVALLRLSLLELGFGLILVGAFSFFFSFHLCINMVKLFKKNSDMMCPVVRIGPFGIVVEPDSGAALAVSPPH